MIAPLPQEKEYTEQPPAAVRTTKDEDTDKESSASFTCSEYIPENICKDFHADPIDSTAAIIGIIAIIVPFIAWPLKNFIVWLLKKWTGPSKKEIFLCACNIKRDIKNDPEEVRKSREYLQTYLTARPDLIKLVREVYGEIGAFTDELFHDLRESFNGKNAAEIEETLKETAATKKKKEAEIERLAESSDDPILKPVLAKAAERLKQSDLPQSIIKLKHAAEISKAENKENTARTAEIYAHIAEQEALVLNYAAAIEYYEKAASKNPENYNYALAVSNYAIDNAQYDKALKYGNAVKEILEKAEDTQRTEYTTALNNIGRAFHAKGEYKAALGYYEKALKIDQEVFGEMHPNVADCYNNIGMALHEKGDYDAALKNHKKALKIDQLALGKKHPKVAIRYNNIGMTLKAKGEYDAALENYETALKIDQVIFGKIHPKIAIRYNNIGLALHAKGDYDEAHENHQKALKINKAIFGDNHPNIAVNYNSIGTALHEKGDYDAALKNFRNALNIDITALGEKHPKVATRYNNVGKTLEKKGDTAGARENLKKALEILENSPTPDHPNIETVKQNLADLEKN